MSDCVGLLILTHRPLAGDLLRIAAEILGRVPAAAEAMEVVNDTPCEELTVEALARLARLDQGAGVLILTDLYGATPANIAVGLLEHRDNLRVVSGINLPMLLRTLNYRTLDLETLAAKARQGGRDAILLRGPREESE